MPNSKSTRRSLLGSAALLAGTRWLPAAEPPASQPSTQPRKPGGRRDLPPRMSFLSNDQIKIGMNLAVGGAITHLSPAKEPEKNLVNSYDLGRQIQMSYYSGPVPYTVPGHAGPPPQWNHIGWNPIQVGDDFGNASKVLEHRNDGKEMYVKCIPMQWPLDDVPGECTFECWVTLEGPTARVRCRLVMTREDKTQWPARTQELPAVYTNGPWYRLMTYTGEKPFASDELKQIEHPFTAQSPWGHWQATERWAALVDDADFGLGIWTPNCVKYSGGFAGKKGKGGPKDAPTGYIAPNRSEILDHNLVHEFEYTLVLGDLKSIRQWVYTRPRPPATPSWSFENDRQGWYYINATDAGWPIRGQLDVDLSGKNPQVISPPSTWQASDGGRLCIEAKVPANVQRIAIYWSTAADPGFSPKRIAVVPVLSHEMQVHRFDLSGNEAYRGLITQIRLDPQGGQSGDRAAIRKIWFQ